MISRFDIFSHTVWGKYGLRIQKTDLLRNEAGDGVDDETDNGGREG